jgi:hypothetical protein
MKEAYTISRTASWIAMRAAALITIPLLSSQVSAYTTLRNPSPGTGRMMKTMAIDAVSHEWTTVNFPEFQNPIPVCSVEYTTTNSSFHPPIVVRMRNVTSSSFDIRLQEPDASDHDKEVTPLNVYCLIVDEGTWKLPDGRKIMASSYTSKVTENYKSSWAGEDQTATVSSFSDPFVVLGQVITYNDRKFSTFWSKGSTNATAASTNAFYAGKHAGKDPNKFRNEEDIGIVVIEDGHGTISGIEFEASRTERRNFGWTTWPTGYIQTYKTNFSSAPQVTIVSPATMSGGHGAWAILAGSPNISSSTISIALDEDLILNFTWRST